MRDRIAHTETDGAGIDSYSTWSPLIGCRHVDTFPIMSLRRRLVYMWPCHVHRFMLRVRPLTRSHHNGQVYTYQVPVIWVVPRAER